MNTRTDSVAIKMAARRRSNNNNNSTIQMMRLFQENVKKVQFYATFLLKLIKTIIFQKKYTVSNFNKKLIDYK